MDVKSIDNFFIFIDWALSMPFDSFCLNEECIKRKSSFFQFDAQSNHIANNHNVKSLHPLTFASYFVKDSKPQPTINAQQLNKQLENTRQQAYQSVVQAVRMLFFDDELVHGLSKQLPLCQDLTIKTIIAKLAQEDYELLQHLRLFELQQRQRNFKTYLLNYISIMQQQLKAHFLNLKKNILKSCQMLQHPHKSPPQTLNIQEKPHEGVFLSHQQSKNQKKNQQEMIGMDFSRLFNETSVKLEYTPVSYQAFTNKKNVKQEQMEYELDDEQEEEQDEGPQKSSAGLEKSKSIMKQSSQTKNQKKRRKRYSLTDGIQIISQMQVIIQQSKYPLKTISFLEEKLPLLTTIHIFHETMARQMFIKQIITTFSKLKRITLNCTFDFQTSMFRQIQLAIPRDLTLQLKWDMSRFFTEYYAYKHFPFRNIRRIERMKSIDMQQLHNLIPMNDSLWDNEPSNNNWMNSQGPRSFHNIKTLRINMKSLDSLYTKQLKNLKIVIISDDWLYRRQQIFGEMIDRNPQLQTMVFNNCQCKDQLLAKMKDLPKLQKLSLINTKKQNLFISQDVFSLIHLTHLNIQGYTFTSQERIKNFLNFRKLMNLKNLKHLSLYKCRIQFNDQLQWGYQSYQQGNEPNYRLESEVLMYISSSAINSLIYLNLGKTNINNDACQYIKKMTFLKYLNIDQTQIEGEALIDAFKSWSRQSFLDVSLKYLSIQANPHHKKTYFTEQNLMEMAKYLKKLTYINVAFIKSIKTYNFEHFQSLKTIGLSESQFNSLDLIISPEVNRYKIKEGKLD